MTSIWGKYDEEIKALLLANPEQQGTWIAKKILNTEQSQTDNPDVGFLKAYVRRNKKRLLDKHEGIYNATKQVDVALTTAKNIWIKTQNKDGHKVSAFVVNPDFVSPEDYVHKEIDFLSIFKDKVKPITYQYESTNSGGFDRFVYTDVHVGMDVDKDGFALYEGKWNEEELNNRLETAVKWICEHKKFDTLYISDLGDFMDGWDGETTRKGHSLPQNMDNQKAFDVGFKFKVRMIDSLVGCYDKIICNNITDDNHSGAFAYVVNSAFKTYIDLKYPDNVTVNIQRKFIDHYTVMNKFTFLESHGKDSGNMKFGFTPQINDKQIKLISNYIDENFLHEKGVVVEFDKGDSHQLLIDKSCSKKFQYHNFMSFAPPSNWVKTNYNNSASGFTFRNYYLNGQMSNHDFIF